MSMHKKSQKKAVYFILSASVIAAVIFLLVPNFYSLWIHGWGAACQATDIQEALSPSKKWIARKQIVGCSVLAGGLSMSIVLVPAQEFLRFFVPEREVFSVDLSNVSMPDSPSTDIQWIDETHLNLVPSMLCGKNCFLSSPVEGINISIAPPR